MAIPDAPLIHEHPLTPQQRFKGSANLKKSGVRLPLTEEMIREIVRCKTDILYFIKNYVKIVSMDAGVIKFNLYPYQEEMVRHYHDNRFSLVLTGRQLGKCVGADTLITVRNKSSGQIERVKISEFHERLGGSCGDSVS